MLNTILFDLDGTLLPLDMDEFMSIYFGEMGKSLHDLIEADKLVSYVWAGTRAMVTNQEKITNEQVFMDTFESLIDGNLAEYQDRFDQFYDDGFLKVQNAVEASPVVKEFIGELKQKGYSLVIATNPLFPRKAILHRIDWAGLNPDDFDYITSYEESCYCKPNIAFYQEVLEKISKRPHQCMMVGNDVQEDMAASKLGIQTYLITNHLLNRHELPLVSDYRSDYEGFARFVHELPDITGSL